MTVLCMINIILYAKMQSLIKSEFIGRDCYFWFSCSEQRDEICLSCFAFDVQYVILFIGSGTLVLSISVILKRFSISKKIEPLDVRLMLMFFILLSIYFHFFSILCLSAHTHTHSPRIFLSLFKKQFWFLVYARINKYSCK